MTKKGSALMQVLVVGLIVATFAILMLRYAVTRSSNISRTERILETEILADSCLEQYMAYLSYAELYGTPPASLDFPCRFYNNMTATVLSTITLSGAVGDNDLTKDLIITNFDVSVNTTENQIENVR
ncbi:MAG: hypothetical protein K6E94_06635 [Elusimicrobiaceae bacterium]|nr:hypothetical protein [Elusimicrobiaceae bacterium]